MEQFLKNVDLFGNLSEKNLKHISGVCKKRSFKDGVKIVQQGDPGEGLFIITSGQVKIVKRTASGAEMVIAHHGPGDFFGEMSVLDGSKRSASVVAEGETECLVLISWEFTSLMKTHPEIALEILPVVVKRFRETNEKLLQLSQS
jgi:CRP/FNR family cyclic AMP-dependent transcriptional regulator